MPRGIYKRKPKRKVREPLPPIDLTNSASLEAHCAQAVSQGHYQLAEAIIALLRARSAMLDAQSALHEVLRS